MNQRDAGVYGTCPRQLPGHPVPLHLVLQPCGMVQEHTAELANLQQQQLHERHVTATDLDQADNIHNLIKEASLEEADKVCLPYCAHVAEPKIDMHACTVVCNTPP